MDDILVFGENREEHLKHLSQVFNRLDQGFPNFFARDPFLSSKNSRDPYGKIINTAGCVFVVIIQRTK